MKVPLAAIGALTLAISSVDTSSAATLTWQGGSGSLTSANWDNDGSSNQNHPTYGSGTIMTVVNSGTVTDFNNATTGNIGNDDSLTIDGGAISGDFLRVASNAASNQITFVSGSITMNSSNSFRIASGGFTGHLNFTGAAGTATLTQTNLGGTNEQTLAGKIGAAGGAFSFFSIDGTMIASGISYDGTNLAAINTALAGNVVGGRYFQISDSGTEQTLNLVAVPEPGTLALFGLSSLLMLRRRR